MDSVNSGAFDAAVDFARREIAEEDWALTETNVGQWALYAQDEWEVNDKFRLTVGLRMDMPLYFDTRDKIQDVLDKACCYIPDIVYFDEDGNDIQFDHLELPEQKPLFSPRLGFDYDIKGDLSSILRGGTGLFTGRLPFVWIGNHVGNPEFYFYQVTRTDFQFPQVWRTNIGFDKKTKGNWTFSGDFIYTKDINAMMVRNYGLKLPSGILNGVDNREIYTADDRTEIFANNAYVFTNSDKGNSMNIIVAARKQWNHGLQAGISYAYLNSEDVSSIEAEISGDAYDRNPALGNVNRDVLAPSLYGNRHRIVGNAAKRFTYGKWATNVSLFFEYVEGGRYSYTYAGDLNRDGSGLNDLIYIPTDGEVDQMTFSGDVDAQNAQKAALKDFIAQDEYLSDNMGSYAEKYGILSPWYNSWDLRLLQDFNFLVNDKTHTIQFSIDFLNFSNLISSEWGVRELPTTTQPLGATIDDSNNPTYSFDTDITSTYVDDFSLNSRWQIQFGLRYLF